MTYPPLRDTVLTMAFSERTSVLSMIQLTWPYQQLWPKDPGPFSLRSMYAVHSDFALSAQLTGTCWAASYWDSQYYYDRVLPFGLRSAPFIFNKFADSLQWILQHTCHLPHVLHNLDDFLDIAGPNQELAETHHDLILDMLKYLHVPVAPEKIEGPATCLTFLGIELDTVALEMRLPLEKKVDFLGTVARILETNHVTSHELASVVGKLSFASRAIPAGRTFLRRLYDFMRATSSAKPYLSLILPDSARDDLVWWAEALTSYSGRSFFLFDKWTRGETNLINCLTNLL